MRRQCQRYDNQQQKVQLHDIQPQEVQQQEVPQRREGKELASTEEKDPLNGVAIGPDGKLKLRDHYDKDHPGLAGGEAITAGVICLVLLKSATQVAFTEILHQFKKMFKRKKESDGQKLDRLIGKDYKTGLSQLEKATCDTINKYERRYFIEEASKEFTRASNVENGFVQVKSMFYTAVCHHLLDQYDIAKKWFKDAYDRGLDECKQSHPRHELEQFKSEFMAPLKDLVNSSYPSTYYNTLSQFNRLEIESPSTSDRVTLQDENKALQRDNQRLESSNRTLQRDKRELQNKVSTLESEKQTLKSRLNQAEQKIQDLERTIRELTQRQDTSDRSIFRNPERLTEITHTRRTQSSVNSLAMYNRRIISGSDNNDNKDMESKYR